MCRENIHLYGKSPKFGFTQAGADRCEPTIDEALQLDGEAGDPSRIAHRKSHRRDQLHAWAYRSNTHQCFQRLTCQKAPEAPFDTQRYSGALSKKADRRGALEARIAGGAGSSGGARKAGRPRSPPCFSRTPRCTSPGVGQSHHCPRHARTPSASAAGRQAEGQRSACLGLCPCG
jgi:hypothetical protein